MFSIEFIKDLAERTISTFVQVYLAGTVVLPGDFFNFLAFKIALGTAILTIFKGIVAIQNGKNKNTASLLR